MHVPGSAPGFAQTGEQFGWDFFAVGGVLVAPERVDLGFGEVTIAVGVHCFEFLSAFRGYGEEFLERNPAIAVGVGTGEGRVAAFAFPALAFSRGGLATGFAGPAFAFSALAFGGSGLVSGFTGTTFALTTLALPGFVRCGQLIALRQGGCSKGCR